MYLFLKLCVLQAKFCWLGAVEETIFPSKASAAGKKTIQGVWGDLVCRIGATNVICQKPLPLTPLGHTHFLPAPPPPPPPPQPGSLDVLLGNFTVSPVAGCTEVHLAGWELFHQSYWESGTDKFFLRKLSLICLKWLQKALFMLCCCF